MAGKNAVPKTTYVDHGVYIPDGLAFVERKPLLTQEDIFPDESLDSAVDDFDIVVEDLAGADIGSDPDTLAVPDSVTIVSQTVRISASGQSVVDVVIDVPDIPGADNYEIRTTK